MHGAALGTAFARNGALVTSSVLASHPFTPLAAPRRSAMAGRAQSTAGRGAGGRGRMGRSGGRGGRGGRRCDPPPSKEQVVFTSNFPEDPITAIIGGGLSGLVCAYELARRGLRSVVFDTGEHGVGGRLGTRQAADGSLKGAPPGLVFDHAAQFFTATDPAFQEMVDRWEANGAVRRWQGPVGTLHDGAFAPDASGPAKYMAPRGMRSLATHLAGQASQALEQAQGSGAPRGLEGLVEVRRPQWVSDARYTREGAEGWHLEGRGRDQGVFDVTIIAHNGKCANRLAAPMGSLPVHTQLKRLKLSANWALLVAFAAPVQVPGGMEGAFVHGSEVLSWAANNSAKLGTQRPGGPECWTLFSTQEYGRANKVPQENVPPEVGERVTQEMLAAFERSLGLPRDSLPPVVYSRTQLWGAALPLNSPRVPCVWDPQARVGVCGDWVLEGGSMQAAALSGLAMAERIDASRGRAAIDIADLALGLTTPFKPAEGEEIGQFPGQASQGAPQARPAMQQRRQGQPKPEQQQRQRQPKPEQQQWRQQQARQPEAAQPALLERPVRQ